MQEIKDVTNQQIIKLDNIIRLLEENFIKLQKDNNTFNDKIELYGIINYSRSQFFPQLSSSITKDDKFKDIFFNYTSVESMILDLFMVIESDLVLVLDETITYDTDKIEKLIIFSSKLLIILSKILRSKKEQLDMTIGEEEYIDNNNAYTQELFALQNEFYALVYNEKIDFRVK
jgi:hypothetical protein